MQKRKTAPTQHSDQSYYKQAVMAFRGGHNKDALKYAFMAFDASPQKHDYRLLLAHTLKDASFRTFDPTFKKTILKLLNAPKLDYQNLMKSWLSIVLTDPALKPFVDLYHGQDYNSQELQNCLNSVFLLKGLESFIVFDFQFERALKILSHLIDSKVIFSKPFEKSLKIYNQHTEGLIFDRDLKPVSINENIPNLSLPENDIHKEVRAQYEANPYPRWISCDVQTPSKDNLNSAHAHLIAGCGTGFGTCLTALRYPNAEITAIDLSLASLSYAQAKAKQLGLKNVTFYQADILKLEKLDREFDVIECSGVLHHMQDPLAGWKSLLKKLKPNGKMHIGLYSELGRQDVVRGRQIVKAQGFKTTPDGIRQARDYIASLPDDHVAKKLLSRRDFYSLSSCRDLIFHTQEIRYSIEMIAESLDSLGLKFDGFDFDNSTTISAYQSSYPDDPHMKNLQNWMEFEAKNPDTFRGMYQFWCSKK